MKAKNGNPQRHSMEVICKAHETPGRLRRNCAGASQQRQVLFLQSPHVPRLAPTETLEINKALPRLVMRQRELAVVVNNAGVIDRLQWQERPSPNGRKNAERSDIIISGHLLVERNCRANQFAAMAIDPQLVPLRLFSDDLFKRKASSRFLVFIRRISEQCSKNAKRPMWPFRNSSSSTARRQLRLVYTDFVCFSHPRRISRDVFAICV